MRVHAMAAVVAAVAAVAACGGSQPARVRRPGTEYLAAIEFDGNEAISSEALLRGLALNRNLKAGRALDEYQLGIDVTRIEGAYKKRGFLSVVVGSSTETNGDATTLYFTIKEGPRATASVEITGLPPEVDPEEARALVKLEDGDPFMYTAFDEAKAPMLALVEDKGYAHAQLDASVIADRAKNTATLRYWFDPGPKVVWGDIKIVGVEGPLADAARARLAFKPGDPYSTKAAAASQQAIYSMGRFKTVRVDVDRSSLATVVPVKVSLEESTRWEARGGIGAGIDTLTYQARLRASLTHVGWPTPLTTLGVEFRPAYTVLRDNCDFFEVWNCDYEPRIRLLGTATQQDLFRPEVRGELTGGLDYLTLEAYTQQGARLTFGIDTPIAARKRLQLHVGYLLAGYDFTDINSLIGPTTAARLGIDHFERLGAFTETLALDFRDNPVSPRLGMYAEFRLAQGGGFAGGQYTYTQVMPELRGYVPVGPLGVLAARARVGMLLGDVPPTERFYAGGASSQRGFAERRLSPTVDGFDANGNPASVVIGGGGLIETGVELRTRFSPLGIKAGGVIFLDGGDVTEDAYDLDPTNLHWAVGIGLRFYYLPIGPIRLEAAYRLNRTGAGEPAAGDRFNYLLSVGESF